MTHVDIQWAYNCACGRTTTWRGSLARASRVSRLAGVCRALDRSCNGATTTPHRAASASVASHVQPIAAWSLLATARAIVTSMRSARRTSVQLHAPSHTLPSYALPSYTLPSHMLRVRLGFLDARLGSHSSFSMHILSTERQRGLERKRSAPTTIPSPIHPRRIAVNVALALFLAVAFYFVSGQAGG